VTLYTDSSALIKRYVAEDDSDAAEAVLLADPEWVTGRHTFVEVMLAIHRRLGDAERTVASAAFERDWQRTFVVALDDAVCRRAAELGIATGARSLDALPNGPEAGRCRSSPSMYVSGTRLGRSGSA